MMLRSNWGSSICLVNYTSVPFELQSRPCGDLQHTDAKGKSGSLGARMRQQYLRKSTQLLRLQLHQRVVQVEPNRPAPRLVVKSLANTGAPIQLGPSNDTLHCHMHTDVKVVLRGIASRRRWRRSDSVAAGGGGLRSSGLGITAARGARVRAGTSRGGCRADVGIGFDSHAVLNHRYKKSATRRATGTRLNAWQARGTQSPQDATCRLCRKLSRVLRSSKAKNSVIGFLGGRKSTAMMWLQPLCCSTAVARQPRI